MERRDEREGPSLMAGWQNKLSATPIPRAKGVKKPKKNAPKLDKQPRLEIKVTPVKPRFPESVIPRKPVAPGPTASGDWYGSGAMKDRDAALAGALSDPLGVTTGDQALAFAKSLVQARTAPVMQEYDRQQGLAESKYGNQSARQSAGTDAIRAAIAQQIAGQQAAQNTARTQIAQAGQGLQGSVDQGLAQAQAAQARDAAVRGVGLDGGAGAAVAADAAAVKARGATGSQIALDAQSAAGAQNNALLNQISAATAQQGGERQGSLTAALNSQLRDLNQNRSRDMSAAQEDFVKTLLDLKQQNTQTALAKETLGLDQEKAKLGAQADAAKLQQDAAITAAKLKVTQTEGAANRAARAELAKLQAQQKDADRRSREGIASANRTSREKTTAQKQAEKAAKPKPLTPQDKGRRQFIRAAEEFYDGGTLKALKAKVDKQGGNASTFRKALANRGIKDTLARQLLADVAYGGLRPNTIAAYKARYGRNPPSSWKRYKPPAPSVKGAADAVADALKIF